MLLIHKWREREREVKDDPKAFGPDTGRMSCHSLRMRKAGPYAGWSRWWNQELFVGHVKFDAHIQAEILCLQLEMSLEFKGLE